MDSTVAPPDGFVVDALPQGFVVDQADPRLAMQDDLARAADRATAAKRNPAKDPEVLALQTKLYKMPAFGSADTAPPDGFVVDQAVSSTPAKDDLYGKAKAMLQQGPQQLNDLLTGENALPVLIGKLAGHTQRQFEIARALQQPDENGVSPIEREIHRRKEAGEPTDLLSMKSWVEESVNKRMHPNKPAPVDPLEYGKQVLQGMADHPLDAAKGFVSYAVTHPEVLAAGPIGGLLIMAGEDIANQEIETGTVDAKKTLVDSGLNATGVLAIHAAVRGANYRAAKTTGAEPTAMAEEQMLEAINAKAKEGISEGQAPQAAATAALDDVLAVMKIAPEERAAIVKGAEDAISEGPKPEGDRQEHQGTGVDRAQAEAGDRDSAARSGQGPAQGESGAVEEPPLPKVSADLQRLQDYERRVQTDVEGLKGEAKYQALRDTAMQIAELQAGKADPKLLAMLALPGIGAAAGYWLGGNTGERVRDALIGGGIGAASLLLGKVRGAALRVVDAISDKRYNPVELFREHAQDIALGRLSGYQFAEGLKALVPNAERRSAMTFALEAGDRSGLSPVESSALGQYEVWMRSVRDGGEKAGVDMGRVLDNYATHAYLRGMNTKEGLVDNLLNIMKEQGGTGGMSPKSRWAKQRVIPSYQEAIARGLIPVTTDIAEIARMYTDSVTRTAANKHFLDALAKSKTPAGEPLLARGADLEKEIKRRQSKVLGRDPEMGPSEKLDADIAAIKAPSDYVFVNHPQLRDFKVHRDMAAPLRALMDATDPLAIEKALHGVAVAAKSVIFSGSLFHAKSLVDAAMGAGLGAFKRGALKEIRDPNNALVKEAVASGLNIIDRPMEAEIAPMRNALRLIEEKTPFPVATSVKAMRTLQDKMNHFLWGVVHPTLKYNVWKSIYERALTDPTIANRIGRKLGMAPNWDGMGRADVARMATSYTNDVFGGINWFEIANSVNSHYLRDLALGFASPRGRRLMQIIMLAPDWTVATARSMYKAFPGMSEPQVAALHRQYLLRQSIIYLTAYNAINQALSGHHIWENKDPTMIDAGDGRRIQMAKHTMEPIHWLTQPGQQLWNKLGYPIKEPILQAFGKDWISLKGGDVGGPPMGNRLAHALKSTLPIPTTTAADKGIVPAVTGFLGVPMYGRTEQQAIDDAIERALNLRAKRLDSDDPAEQAKANKKSQSETAASARARVTRQYQKQRDEQRQREAR